MIDDRHGAFCAHDSASTPGAKEGPLARLTFAVKDVFDVAGQRTGAGNPDWLRTHPPAGATAPVVQQALDAGADLVGRTHTDELTYSLNGENHHYGTPVNPRNPDRIPGGSSSGSAVAVAAGYVDFALGTDTAGSVRLPACFCGIYGLRTSHGLVSKEGVAPLAPSYDTVGWFARSLEMLERVAGVLLPAAPATGAAGRDRAAVPLRLLVAEDAFALARPDVRAALEPVVERLRGRFERSAPITLAEDGLLSWQQTFRVFQGWEVWQTHGRWITATRPSFGPGVRERFEWAATVRREDAERAATRREEISARLDELLADAVVCMPTVSFVAPLRGATTAEQDRTNALSLLCVASLARLPQVTLPVGQAEGCQVALSLVGRHGADRAVLEAARRVARSVA
jgi:amidase